MKGVEKGSGKGQWKKAVEKGSVFDGQVRF